MPKSKFIKNDDYRHVIRCLIVAVAVIFLLAGSLVYILQRIEMNSGVDEDLLYDDGENEQIYVNGVCYRAKNLKTCLIIGLDKYKEDAEVTQFNNQQQADFMILLALDEETQTGFAIHLNRDTMTQIPMLGLDGEDAGTYTAQLALAHTYGSGQEDSCRNTVKAVSNLLYDLPIQHYVSVTMDAVKRVNNAVGGVTVLVEDDFRNVDNTLIQGQTICLNGDQALHFVRARGGMEDAGNLRRMERQRTYLKALREQAVASLKNDSTLALSTLNDVTPYMVTDCTIYELAEFVDGVTSYTLSEIETIPGNAVVGQTYMEYYVDETALQNMVLRLFYKRDANGN